MQLTCIIKHLDSVWLLSTFFSFPHKIRMQNVTALLFGLCNMLLGHDTVQLSLLHPLRTRTCWGGSCQ
jgi:hypothetical protein